MLYINKLKFMCQWVFLYNFEIFFLQRLCHIRKMKTNLSKQLATRLKAKNISVHSLEKEAGLKTHAVRNIVRGKSKKPSAEIMQAIADVLGCTVRDLLESPDIFDEISTEEVETIVDKTLFTNRALLEKTVVCINSILSKSSKEITIRQALTCIEEVYVHALKNGANKPDEEFASWFIDLIQS